MTKARDLADLISTGNPLADGAIAVAEVTGAAPLASPTFTGTPSAPTASAGTNTTQIATTAFVQTDLANLVDSAPDALNTLNELAAALGDDANFSTTVTNSIATKAPTADPTFTGDVTLPDKIVHTGDTNTAIRFPAADTVSFETGGSERFRFASSGQLGIGGATYGTSGQVLTSGGASAAPTWSTISAGDPFSGFGSLGML